MLKATLDPDEVCNSISKSEPLTGVVSATQKAKEGGLLQPRSLSQAWQENNTLFL